MLVTALEACPDVPAMDVVMECLLHQERKLSGCADAAGEKALAMKGKQPKKKGSCHHCGKMGHYKRDYWKRKTEPQKEGKGSKQKISLVAEVSGLAEDDKVLVVGHAMSIGPSGQLDS